MIDNGYEFDDNDYLEHQDSYDNGDFDEDTPYDEFAEDDNEQKLSELYTHRRLQQNLMARKIRQSQMWINRVRGIVRFLFILGLIAVGYKALKLHQWYLPSNALDSINNKSLEISNNRIVPSAKVLAALRRTELPSVPIYLLKTDEIKHNIMQLDPVDNVYIRRFWFPARLQIIIEEKMPVITISPGPNIPPIAFFTDNGKLIGRDYLPLDKSFKTVLVFSLPSRNDDYKNWTLDKIKLIERLAKSVKANSKEDIEYIDLRNPSDVYIKIKTANIRLGALNEDALIRIGRLPSILPQVKLLDKPIKYIDLRWQNTNYIKLG